MGYSKGMITVRCGNAVAHVPNAASAGDLMERLALTPSPNFVGHFVPKSSDEHGELPLPALGAKARELLGHAAEIVALMGQDTLAKGMAQYKGCRMPGKLARDLRTIDGASALLRHPLGAGDIVERLRAWLGNPGLGNPISQGAHSTSDGDGSQSMSDSGSDPVIAGHGNPISQGANSTSDGDGTRAIPTGLGNPISQDAQLATQIAGIIGQHADWYDMADLVHSSSQTDRGAEEGIDTSTQTLTHTAQASAQTLPDHGVDMSTQTCWEDECAQRWAGAPNHNCHLDPVTEPSDLGDDGDHSSECDVWSEQEDPEAHDARIRRETREMIDQATKKLMEREKKRKPRPNRGQGQWWNHK